MGFGPNSGLVVQAQIWAVPLRSAEVAWPLITACNVTMLHRFVDHIFHWNSVN